jgi:hypothetical protein|tara:strand:- start:43 stop:735 length:693 start_codon:yes stop_codon:yes gene_type:complete
MGFFRGPNIVTDGLILALDAASPKSYPGSGTTWKDLSGNGNNGTLTNGPTFSNGAIVFDGANDYTRITNNSTIDFTTNSFSLHVWVRTHQVGATRFIMGKGDGISIASSTGYSLYLGNTGTTWLFGVWDGTGNTSAGSTDYVEVNTWVNLCGVYNSTDNSHKLYTNSELVDTDIRAVDSISTVNDLYVGAGPQGSGDWNGDIAITQVYNRALTADEVSQNYNALKSRFGL